MNDFQLYQQDIRIHGKQTADDLAAVRRLVEQNRRLVENLSSIPVDTGTGGKSQPVIGGGANLKDWRNW